MERKNVAFFSERNVCRSIIAEAYLRRLGRPYFNAHSFGIRPDRVHYLVREVLESRGFNLNYFFSKYYEVIENQKFDIIVLMHPSLEEKLPEIPYPYEKLVWEFEDPTARQLDRETMRREIEALCDAVESRVKAFVDQYRTQPVE
ncbi:MAG: hypothetical protein D6715_12650 [Calditrichaeota bacterium]|nr:MAG: hypothetical protein D6715_12650 [Calditrichota bacterium]